MSRCPRNNRDSGRKRRKKTGYIVFYMSLLKAYPKCLITTVAKKAGQLWHAMSPCEKEKYNETARQPPKKRTCRVCQANMRPGRNTDRDTGRNTGGDTDDGNSCELSTASVLETVECVFSNARGQENQRESRHLSKESVAESRKRYVSTSDNCNCRTGLYSHDQPGTSDVRTQDQHSMYTRNSTVTETSRCSGHEAQTCGDHESVRVVELRCPCGITHEIPVADMKRGESKQCQCGRVAGPPSRATRCSCWGCSTNSSVEQHHHRSAPARCVLESPRCREDIRERRPERDACCSRQSRSRTTERVDQTKKRRKSNSSRCCCGKQGFKGKETPVKKRRQDDDKSTRTEKQTASRNKSTTSNSHETSEKKKHNSAWYT